MKAYQSKDPIKLKTYNALDCVATARVFEKMRHEMRTGRQVALYEHNAALSNLAARMYRRGFWVDQEMRNYLRWGLEVEYREKEQRLLEMVGIKDFTCSPESMRSLIWKRHATPQIQRYNLPDPFDGKMWTSEERRTIKVDFKTLLLVVANPGYPKDLKQIIEAYWAAEEVWKARSTFIASELIENAIGPDGRLRAGWNALGTDTGRWSCKSPNIQTLPQYLRAMYGAPLGRVLVHADFSQLELRVMCAVAHDEVLRLRLESGDVYTADARAWFRVPEGQELKKASRKQAKVIHLASQYGAGVKTVYLQVLKEDRSISFNACKLLNQEFMNSYHRTVSYWDEELERIAATGYSESRILHRRKVFPKMPERSQAVNFPIQSTAADIANLWYLEVDKRLQKELPSAFPVHQFHDAGDIECDEDDADKVKNIMMECAAQEHNIEGKMYAFPMEIKVSSNWADL